MRLPISILEFYLLTPVVDSSPTNVLQMSQLFDLPDPW